MNPVHPTPPLPSTKVQLSPNYPTPTHKTKQAFFRTNNTKQNKVFLEQKTQNKTSYF